MGKRKPSEEGDVIAWLNTKLPNGLYGGPARAAFKWCGDYLSLNICFHAVVRRRLSLGADDKVPKWVSELYQVAALGCAVLLLGLASYLPYPWRLIPGLAALYWPFEIFVFAVAWVFLHTSPIYSYKRGLVGFLVNLGEVVVAFASTYLALGCVSGIPVALYSSLRTLVTIGPVATHEPPGHALCGLAIAGQIIVSYFLTAVIVASAVGALRQRPEVRRGPTTA